MRKKVKIIFFGDLAPEYLSGTSIAAKINLDALKDKYHIFHIEEGDNWRQHSKKTLLKISSSFQKAYIIYKVCKSEKPAMFYSHLPSSSFGILKIVLANLAVISSSSAKIILHLHRGDFRDNYEKSFFFRILTKIIDRQVNTLITLSPNHKESLINIFQKSDIDILENTIEKEYLFEKKDNKKISFLFISNYIEEKGILDVLSVFKEIKENHQHIELHTYGNTFDEKLKKEIDKFNDNKNIFIHDKIQGAKKFEVMANSSYFILPSWNEGQPLVIMEAMSQALPVIATNVGFIPEILDENYPYLFEPQNKKSLKKMLIKAIDDDNNNVVGLELQKRYYKMFSIEIHNNKLLKIFENIKELNKVIPNE